jgi:replicative DNA helicase
MMMVSWTRPDLERALLGCILENGALVNAADLDPSDFSVSSNACIFKRMVAMRNLGEGIDLFTISHRLEAHAEFDRIGGIEYLGGLIGGAVHENFSTYVRILHDTAGRRWLKT